MNHVYRLRGRTSLVLMVLLTAFGIAAQVAISQYRVIGYYPMWSRNALPASAVRFNHLTHLMHAFAWPNADGSIASDEAVVDTALINTTHRAGRRILLSFGGAGGTQTANFSIVAADTTLRRIFINNVVDRLLTYHYDGADLDWEGPANFADKVNDVALVREMRTAFHAADTSWLLTMAVGVSNWSGQWRDFASLKNFIDWFGAMTYDIHGGWSPRIGHNAPLYPGDDQGSVHDGIVYLNQTRGIPGSQLVLGMPFYGKEWQGTALTLYGPFTAEVDRTYPDALYNIAHNWLYVWDNVAKAPYLLAPSGTRLLTFEDSTSLTFKCSYARAKGLSGVMIWEISQDLVAGGGQPLMDAVGKAMSTTLDVAPGQNEPVAEGFKMLGNYPNPFNPATIIAYQLPASGLVTLTVFDVLGREVATLVKAQQPAGRYRVQFDGSGCASGMYFYRLEVRQREGGDAGEFRETGRMVLVR